MPGRGEGSDHEGQLAWDAQSDAGLRVPNGTYLIEVAAKGPDGAASRALQAAAVGRQC